MIGSLDGIDSEDREEHEDSVEEEVVNSTSFIMNVEEEEEDL